MPDLTEDQTREHLNTIQHDGHALAVEMANEWLDQITRLPSTIPARTESVVRGRDEKGRIVSTETITHSAKRRNYNTAVHGFLRAAQATLSEHRPLDCIFWDTIVVPYCTTMSRVKHLAASTDHDAFIQHALRIMEIDGDGYTAALTTAVGKANRQLQRLVSGRVRFEPEQAQATP